MWCKAWWGRQNGFREPLIKAVLVQKRMLNGRAYHRSGNLASSVNWRVRQSLMARLEPQCEHFRR